MILRRNEKCINYTNIFKTIYLCILPAQAASRRHNNRCTGGLGQNLRKWLEKLIGRSMIRFLLHLLVTEIFLIFIIREFTYYTNFLKKFMRCIDIINILAHYTECFK